LKKKKGHPRKKGLPRMAKREGGGDDVLSGKGKRSFKFLSWRGTEPSPSPKSDKVAISIDLPGPQNLL